LNVLFYTAADDGGQWIAALHKALPEANVTVWPNRGEAVDYALVWKPPPELVAGLAGVRAVFNLGAGIDALAELKWPAGVLVVRLVDAGMAVQMAEYATYAVLRCYREFAAYEGSQRQARWEPRARIDKGAFNVGILGLGALGTAVAQAIVRLGFPVTGCSRSPKTLAGVQSFVAEELPAFLATCRVLVCLLPLTAETHGLLDGKHLSRLPRGAYVVNASRGALLVDADLLALIDAGHISGAMLDVFHDEPLPSTHAFWHHPRITITPHVSAITQIEASVAQVASNIRRLEAGLPITGVVDHERGY
jgi:glyoxylate/hydroxypyruvate reductase A